jgi:hypothetical protein
MDAQLWESIARRRREDLLVYLALARFRKRPKLSQLRHTLQRDMKAFFGAYSRACTEADALLFQAGDPAAVDDACHRSKIGKLLPDDLPLRQALLSPLPRLRHRPAPGPASLRQAQPPHPQIDCYDYADSPNPPILHRKECFLLPDHDLYSKFARLTAQEEKHGLLDNPSTIGTRHRWETRLRNRGFEIKGHRLSKAQDGCMLP